MEAPDIKGILTEHAQLHFNTEEALTFRQTSTDTIFILRYYAYLMSDVLSDIQTLIKKYDEKIKQDEQKEREQFEATHTFRPLPMSKGGVWLTKIITKELKKGREVITEELKKGK